ncbi:MAG: SH3 domain-containing protein [Anaerolineae bacterium]
MSSEDLITAVEHILERLKRGPATEADLETLRRALQAKEIDIAKGQRAVNVGGSVTGAVVVAGDNNRVLAVFNETDEYALSVLEKLTPRPAWPLLVAGLAGVAGLAVVAFVLLFLLGIITIPTRAVVAHGTWLYSSPDRKSVAIARLNAGQRVEVLGQIPETLWLHVTTDEGDQGWVSKGNLENLPKDILPAANPATSTPTPTATPTWTPTNTATPTATASSVPTLTPTSTPLPEAAKVYYLIVLDASIRMTDSFGGSATKWNAARESALELLAFGLPSQANYGLMVLGGNQPGSTQTCNNPNQMLVPLGRRQREAVIERIENLEPQGVASLTGAFAKARDELLKLPPDFDKTIIVITGGGDSCRPDDEWGLILDLLELSGGLINAQLDLVILADETIDAEVEAAVRKVTQLGMENVRAEVPSNQEVLANTIDEVADSAVERARAIEPTAIAAEEAAEAIPTSTPLPKPTTPLVSTPQPTSISTPTYGPTPSATYTTPATGVSATPSPRPTAIPTSTLTPTATPSNTPPPLPTPTHTATATPMPTNTPTPTPTSMPSPTSTPTALPMTVTPLPPQNEVYAQDCPLIDQTSGFNEFQSNQATISSRLVSGGRTGQGLRLDFTALGIPYSYSGWEALLGDIASGVNLTSYTSLRFYIRGAQGGETPNVWLMTPVEGGGFRRYYRDVEAYKTLTTQWQEIVIPLADFTTGTLPSEQIDLRHINKIQVVFEWYEETKSGTIYIDDLCVGP